MWRTGDPEDGGEQTERVREAAEFHHLHAGLTVSMISTKREDFVCCGKEDRLGAVVAGNSEKFDYMPVQDSGDDDEHIVGVVHLAGYYETPAPEILVSEAYEPLAESHLIGADASILSFVREADARPFRLLVSERGIVGLVSLSDLQNLPVRAAFFGLVTGLEMAMTDTIRLYDPDGSKWRTCISGPRQISLNSRIDAAQKISGIVNELLFTEFCDKSDILRKLVFAGDPRRNEFKEKLKAIEKLRNDLAHANHYADTNEKAADVCRVVRDILLMHEVVRSGMAKKGNRVA